MRKILFLYSEIGPYFYSFVKDLPRTEYIITVVHWTDKLQRPHEIYNSHDNIFFHPKESNLISKIRVCNYDLIYVSGWMDFEYLKLAYKARKINKKVVVGFDDRWRGTFKQYFGSFISRFIIKRFFNLAWVSGHEQFHYARRMGFNLNEIKPLLLTTDFQFKDTQINFKAKGYFFVGTMRKVKGIDILFDAYKLYKSSGGKSSLTIIGNNKGGYNIPSGVDYLGFLGSEEIKNILIKKSKCLIVPSRREQWGVVINESLSLGIPVIVSENVGSIGSLLIDNYNGFVSRLSPYDLCKAMLKFDSLEEVKLAELSENALTISSSYNRQNAIKVFNSFFEL